MANVQIRIDDQLRNQAHLVAQSMGLDLSAAVRIFLVQMVRENGLPFRPTADPFYQASNMEALSRSINQLNNGQTITKTLEDLENMAE